MNALNLNFLCNNIKGLQTSTKRLKLVDYSKNKIFPNGILFLQENHCTMENEIKCKDEFDCDLYFSQGKSNLCGILIGFSGNKTFTVKKHLCDENGRILILETLIEFILINLYNANTVGEQIKIFNELNTMQQNLVVKNTIFAGDFNLFLNCSLDSKGGSASLKSNL